VCVLQQHYTYQGKFLRTETATSKQQQKQKKNENPNNPFLTQHLYKQRQPKDPNCTLNLDSLFPPFVGLTTQLMIQVGNIITHIVNSLIILLAKKKKKKLNLKKKCIYTHVSG
jgi:hypothetical protein